MKANGYFDAIERRFGKNAKKRIKHQMDFLYRAVDFEGKTVLDIGGGIGLHSLFAASQGAAEVTIIEPEGDGGHGEMIATFNTLRTDLGASNVELIQTTFQEYLARNQKFDIILIQDAINHFDEEACVTLLSSEESQKTYQDIFSDIAKLITLGGVLIMSDCSSKNFFDAIGMTNPVAKQIEWEKHQPPSVWAKLASSNGLKLTKTRWSSPTKFGSLGRFLMGNAILAWFFTSHFVMTLRKA